MYHTLRLTDHEGSYKNICSKIAQFFSSAEQPSHPAARSQKSDQVGDHHIRKINDTKNAISHELLGLEKKIFKENSWYISTLNFFLRYLSKSK